MDCTVVMRRPNLDDLPSVRLPEGYDLRVFRPEDEAAWNKLIYEAFAPDVGTEFFDERMRHDPDYFDPGSIFILWKGDQLVATASAWQRGVFGPDAGYLHMVAVVASERGKGLGYQISLACLHKMASEGRKFAVLRTQVARILAIKTYLKLGFEPWVTEDEHRGYWDEARRLISEV